MKVADYKELRVYRLAFESAMQVFELSRNDHICRQLTKMMTDAASWCGTGCELREVPPEHLVPPTLPAPNAPRSNAPRSPHSTSPDAPRSTLPNAPRS
jgi:hypothetical protein